MSSPRPPSPLPPILLTRTRCFIHLTHATFPSLITQNFVPNCGPQLSSLNDTNTLFNSSNSYLHACNYKFNVSTHKGLKAYTNQIPDQRSQLIDIHRNQNIPTVRTVLVSAILRIKSTCEISLYSLQASYFIQQREWAYCTSRMFHLSIHSVSISHNSQHRLALVLYVDTHNMRKFLHARKSKYSSVTAKN